METERKLPFVFILNYKKAPQISFSDGTVWCAYAKMNGFCDKKIFTKRLGIIYNHIAIHSGKLSSETRCLDDQAEQSTNKAVSIAGEMTLFFQSHYLCKICLKDTYSESLVTNLMWLTLKITLQSSSPTSTGMTKDAIIEPLPFTEQVHRPQTTKATKKNVKINASLECRNSEMSRDT